MPRSYSKKERVKGYWEQPGTISLLDKNLRQIEEEVVLSYLKPYYNFVDLGCGDGISTLKYAQKVKSCLAFDQSKYLISKAKARFKKSGIKNTEFKQGDIMNFKSCKKRFDAVLTQRLIINLLTWQEQKQAIKNIHSCIKPGGLYIMIENTFEGFEALNKIRRAVGLGNIPLHWHNLFFNQDKLFKFLAPLFDLEKHHTFDLYYLLTRVYVNMFANFEGWGANVKKDKIFDYSDPAALKLFKLIGDKIRLDPKISFGPIQAFILRKKI